MGDAVAKASRVDGARLLRVPLGDEADLLKRLGERLVDGFGYPLRVVLAYLQQVRHVGREKPARRPHREALLGDVLHHVAVAVGVGVLLGAETLLGHRYHLP